MSCHPVLRYPDVSNEPWIGRDLGIARRNVTAILAVLVLLIASDFAAMTAEERPQSASDVEELSFVVLQASNPSASFAEICCADQQFENAGALQTSLKTDYGPTANWIKFVEPAKRSILVLTTIVDEAVLYVRDPLTGAVRSSRIGDTIPVSSRELVSARLAFPLTDADTGAELYMQIVQPTQIILRFSRMAEHYFSMLEGRMNTLRAFLIGGILIIILYNLVLSMITRDATFLFNCLTIFSLLLLDLYLSGIGSAYLWGDAPWVSNLVLPFSLSGPVIFGSIFFYLFVRKRGETGFLHNGVFFVLPALSVLALCSLLFVPYWMVQPAVLLLGAAVMLLMTVRCGTYAWHGRIHALVLLVPLLMAVAPGLTIVTLQKIYGVDFGGLDQHMLELTLILEALLFSFALAYRIRLAEQERLIAHTALESHNVQSRENLLKSIDEERTRIAGELHETAGHGLLAVASRLEHLSGSSGLPTQISDELEEISEVSNVLVGEIRRISHDLHTGALDHLGLKKAIEGQLEHLRAAGLAAEPLEMDIEEDLLCPEQKLHIYRIVQELLVNINKHSSATAVGTSLKRQGEMAILTVVDNGQGMPADANGTGSGLGLSFTGQRAEMLSANWTTESGPGGTTIRLTFPLTGGDNRTETVSQDGSSGGQSPDLSRRHSGTDRGTGRL